MLRAQSGGAELQQCQRVLLALKRLETSRPAAAAGEKLRLALVTPFPPDRTGIARYGAELAKALSEHYEITLITSAPARARAQGWTAEGEAWFTRRAAEFDRVLYQFGNAPFHLGMVDLLERHPGVVLLHDFGLGDLCLALDSAEGRSGRWARTLYESHGYSAVKSLANATSPSGLLARHPSSGFVFEQSQRVLVHSAHARDLAALHYGPDAAMRTAVTPFLQSARETSRVEARRRLGVGRDELLVCSFGFGGETKLTHRVVEAWLSSGLQGRGRLVFVGELAADAYGAAVRARLHAAAGGTVRITGYVDDAIYDDYLAAADFAVQLRLHSRGESSAALFDCMAAGLPVVVNAHGSLAETPSSAALLLSEVFEDAELVSALRRLADNPQLRARMSAAGRRVIANGHDPALVAVRVRAELERAAREAEPLHDPRALAAARVRAGGRRARLPALLREAQLLAAASGPRPGLRQMFVDVTAIAELDLQTGIQRVVRAQLQALLDDPPPGCRVEPVRLAPQADGGVHLVYARRYASRLLELPEHWLQDQPVEVRQGDIYYVPDLAPAAVAAAEAAGLLQALRDKGVGIHVLVHDILPLTVPQHFPPGADEVHERWLRTAARAADQLIAISGAVRSDLLDWLERHEPGELQRLRISRLPHGADFEKAPHGRVAGDALPVDVLEPAMPTFLMVGTVEPRKGYDQALSAFERLWAQGLPVRLVIVGAEGWRGLPERLRRELPHTVQRLQRHPELGHRLHWLQDADDVALQQLLQRSSCLLAASWGEGFGLPLIEAARHRLPILARDIPVFREVAGRHAAFFSASDPAELACALADWLALRQRGEHQRSEAMPYIDWAENARRLALMVQPASSPN
jgi:glycosyltransferase involved in cell wall biosynthesis